MQQFRLLPSEMVTMIILFMLPVLISCSSDGNIHLLEEDIAIALRNCHVNDKTDENARQRRTSDTFNDPSPRIDANSKQEMNQYNHERRNTNSSKMHVLNGSNNDYSDYGAGDGGEKFVNTIPRPALGSTNTYPASTYANSARIKRNEPLISKDDNEQCLSQCVFANLQVVDSKGIPREAELWNKVQSSVTSQQSRTVLKDQIHACFQELQSESEDNGCYYSNKLERCLMFRFSDRKINGTQNTST
ncbi:uncharacterized protein LOC123875379 [Maniola jurtina]|uniref:uncharacterized protein LOC123875379 n=1 Tax=Maniola jurtina TaxID=191418 RepID=UPI001E68ED70|nr:uncharacterized protein LOC123875379 [Maniola jurtina]